MEKPGPTKKKTVIYEHRNKNLTVGFLAWTPYVPGMNYRSPIEAEGIPHYLAVMVDAQIQKIMLKNKGW